MQDLALRLSDSRRVLTTDPHVRVDHELVALDAKNGQEIWRSHAIDRYTGCSMALKGDRLVYQSARGVFCLDANSGKQNWAVEKDIPYGRGNAPHTLVLSDDAAYSEEGKSVFAYALADGSDRPSDDRVGVGRDDVPGCSGRALGGSGEREEARDQQGRQC